MYQNYYNLERKPFENTPDPRFLFLSKKHREVLASLVYGIKAAKGFILIAGDIGTGKTTLLHCLLKDISRYSIAVNVVNPRSTFKDITNYLAQKLGISLDGKNELDVIAEFQHELEILNNRGKRVVLIIDEAHLLRDSALEDLRLLSNIENETSKLIQIILAGQNEVYKKLDKESAKPFKQRLVINRRLEPLNKKETFHYITHRLAVAGRRAPLFEKNAVTLIWERSRGIPRLVNQICDNALLIGYAIDANSIGPKIIREVIKDMESDHKEPTTLSHLILHKLRWIAPVTICILMILYLSFSPYIDRLSHLGKIVPTSSFVASNNTGSLPMSDTKMISEAMRHPVMRSKIVNDTVKATQAIAVPSPTYIAPTTLDGFRRSKSKNPAEMDIPASPEMKSLTIKDEYISEQLSGTLDTKSATEVSVKEVIPLKRPTLSKPRKVINSQTTTAVEKKKVRPRDHLFKIALEQYGAANDTIFDFIQMSNPDIKDIHTIYVNQRIVLPHIEKDDLIVNDDKLSYFIHCASFYKYDDARDFVDNFHGNSREIFVIPAIQGANVVYRIYLGVYTNRGEAKMILDKLRLKHLSFLKRPD